MVLNEYKIKIIKKAYCQCPTLNIKRIDMLCGVCRLIYELNKLKKDIKKCQNSKYGIPHNESE